MTHTRNSDVRRWFSRRFELSRGGGAHNIRPMEGLRGLAALLVFVTHYIGFIGPFMDPSLVFTKFTGSVDVIGNSGVDLFFVLSGYLIYGSLIARPQAFTQFMWRRIVRIYPVFIAMFLVYVLLSLLFPAESKIPPTTLGAAGFLLGNFLLLPGFFPFPWMIAVSWSLSYEMFYYLAIPLLTGTFSLRRRSPVWRVVFFSAIAVAYGGYCAVYGGRPRLIMFIAGILLYETIKHSRLRPPGSALTALIVFAGLAAQVLPIPGGVGDTLRVLFLFVSFFLLCFCCFAAPGAWLRRAFEWTPLRWFGNMSYSFYMVHALALQFGVMVLAAFSPPAAASGPLFFWALLPVLFAGALVPSVLLYLLIERPFSLRSMKKETGAAPAPGAPSVPTPRAAPTPRTVQAQASFFRRRPHLEYRKPYDATKDLPK